jgi:hypothetical protein
MTGILITRKSISSLVKLFARMWISLFSNIALDQAAIKVERMYYYSDSWDAMQLINDTFSRPICHGRSRFINPAMFCTSCNNDRQDSILLSPTLGRSMDRICTGRNRLLKRSNSLVPPTGQGGKNDQVTRTILTTISLRSRIFD